MAEDHQRKNAEALSDRGAAVTLLDRDCRDQLADTVEKLLASPDRLRSLGENAKAMALPDADEKIVDALLQLVHRQ